MSTKFTLSVILMELAAQMEAREVRMDVKWVPRERNQEADDLSNGQTSAFSTELEGKAEFERISWLVLPKLLKTGQQRKAALEEKKEERRKPKRRKKEEKLKFRDPWGREECR